MAFGSGEKKKKLGVLDLSKLRKKYPDSGVADIIVPDEKSLRLPTRCLGLNNIMGGGIPFGKILEIIGYESTGKTMIAYDFAYTTQKLGGKVLWADMENVWTNSWAKNLGVDPKKVDLLTDNNAVEYFADWVRDSILYWRSVLTNNEPILVVLDSIAALDIEGDVDQDQSGSKAKMGNRAKAIYAMFRNRNKFFSKYGATVVAINQVRKKLGATLWEAAETTPGGEATKFYSSIRLMLHRSKSIKGVINSSGEFAEDWKNGIRIGQNVRVEVLKNKTAAPENPFMTQVYFKDMRYGYIGYNRYMGILEKLVSEGIIEQGRGSIKFKGEKIAGKEETFYEVLQHDTRLRKAIIKDSSIHTLTKARERLKELDVNLYPVRLKSSAGDEGDNE